MTREDVMRNLESLIGREFEDLAEMNDEVIIAFGAFEESGETDVYFGESNNDGYDYIAYINAEESTQFLFNVDKETLTIESVRMA